MLNQKPGIKMEHFFNWQVPFGRFNDKTATLRQHFHSVNGNILQQKKAALTGSLLNKLT